jgi:hypothetical protein
MNVPANPDPHASPALSALSGSNAAAIVAGVAPSGRDRLSLIDNAGAGGRGRRNEAGVHRAS